MYYYELDDKKNKWVAAIATALYAVIVAVLFLTVHFTMQRKADTGGMLVDFGSTETGLGADDMMLSRETFLPESAPSQQTQLLTQDFEDAPAAADETPAMAVNEDMAASQPVPEQPVQTREVNRRALFPGNTDRSTSVSQGVGGGDGNQGTLSGAQADNYAEGSDGSGISFSLSGRRPVGEFPRPSYDVEEQGRVVIEIAVNAKGEVVSAEFHSRGSTTQNASLVAAAKRAALKARFSVSEKNDLQIGTIEYVFKLK